MVPSGVAYVERGKFSSTGDMNLRIAKAGFILY